VEVTAHEAKSTKELLPRKQGAGSPKMPTLEDEEAAKALPLQLRKLVVRRGCVLVQLMRQHLRKCLNFAVLHESDIQ
jgi:hypothetical protein